MLSDRGIAKFQFTASQGGWLLRLYSSRSLWTFQFTASQGGWRARLKHSAIPFTYFNSQPRKEADRYWRGKNRNIYISIHSLARRLTHGFGFTNDVLQYFNSQPRKEADLVEMSTDFTTVISIHSLARRLTADDGTLSYAETFQFTASQGGWPTTHRSYSLISHFNSQPRKEADNKYSATQGSAMVFQFTASQGGWLP